MEAGHHRYDTIEAPLASLLAGYVQERCVYAHWPFVGSANSIGRSFAWENDVLIFSIQKAECSRDDGADRNQAPAISGPLPLSAM